MDLKYFITLDWYLDFRSFRPADGLKLTSYSNIHSVCILTCIYICWCWATTLCTLLFHAVSYITKWVVFVIYHYVLEYTLIPKSQSYLSTLFRSSALPDYVIRCYTVNYYVILYLAVLCCDLPCLAVLCCDLPCLLLYYTFFTIPC